MLCLPLHPALAEPFPMLQLHNSTLQLNLTPSLGGRVIGFNLRDKSNFLKIGDAFNQAIQAHVSANAESIDYFGHIVWLGPQSQWWQKQRLNQTRFTAGAQWPPDPYVIFADNKLLTHSATEISLQGKASPISGMQLNKRFYLHAEIDNLVSQAINAINISKSEQAWDIWFNTRVSADTHIVVPVADFSDVRISSFEDQDNGPVSVNLESQLLNIDITTFSRDKTKHKGKIFIQPSQGWLAGYKQGQLFIIQFPLLAANLIHPEQGQVEVYVAHQQAAEDKGLIEMELHTAFQHLAPGQSMRGQSNWFMFDYPQDASQQQILAILQTKIQWINNLAQAILLADD
jgi:hypothetical protein